MYGIRFCTEGGIEFVLSQILSGREIEPYVWKVDCLWIEGPDEYDDSQAEGKMLSTKELMDAFSCIESGFMYFGRLRRYVHGAKVDEIETFQEFDESECSMIILCVDRREYEVYGKDREEMEKIFADISKVALFEELEFESEQQIERTELTV